MVNTHDLINMVGQSLRRENINEVRDTKLKSGLVSPGLVSTKSYFLNNKSLTSLIVQNLRFRAFRRSAALWT